MRRWLESLCVCVALGVVTGCAEETKTTEVGSNKMAVETPPEPETEERFFLPTDAEAERNRQVAKTGVGKKGSKLPTKGIGGMIAKPAVTLARVKEQVVFEFQIPQAMQLYHATHGKGPQSHEEFMEKIIKPNMIKLPELPEGYEYEFDVDEQILMVLVPKESS